MEATTMSWAVLLFGFLLLLLSRWLLQGRNRPKDLPPGPPTLPLIGHLHLLRRPLHHSLTRLAHRYGPVLYLHFGSRPVVVVSSPSSAEECYTKNDVVFANRPRLLNTKYIHYDCTTLAAAPYGPHWRNLRRVTALHIFATSRVNSLSGVREEEVRVMLRQLCGAPGGAGGGFRKVDMRSVLGQLTFNTVMRMVSGKSYHRESAADAGEGKKVWGIVEEILHFTNVSSLEDFIPALRWVDIGGLKRRMMRLRRRMDMLFQAMIDARREVAASTRRPESERGETKKTFIDVLLGLQDTEGDYYTDNIIKGVIQVLITAGIETTFVTLEWAMALLLNHPETLKKARAEIDAVVGHQRLLESSDLPNLPYLHNIIKETLRVHQPGPLLVPHESSGECTVGGFRVPPGTMLLVNAYAIHRDPTVWTAPEEFRPERFEDGDQGGGYKMIAFGSGRRGCPGEGLAMSLMALALGSLIQSFEWDRLGEKMVDMAEKEGITVPMAKPLEALCRPRLAMHSVLSQL